MIAFNEIYLMRSFGFAWGLWVETPGEKK